MRIDQRAPTGVRFGERALTYMGIGSEALG